MTLSISSRIRLFAAMGGIVGFVCAISPGGGAHAADITCVAAPGVGVSCLTAKGWQVFDRASGKLRSNYVYDMAACRGRIYVSASRAVHAFDGAKWSKPNVLPSGVFARRIACDGAGGLWVSGGTGLARWTGSGWKVVDTGKLLGNARYKYVTGLAAGRNGGVWVVAGGRTAARYRAGDWTLYRHGEGFERKLSLRLVLTDGRGAVWLPHAGGLAIFRGGAWKTIPGPGGARHATRAPDGALWLATGRRLTRFRDGKWRRTVVPYGVNGMAAGADGRLWAASDFGVGVMRGGRWAWRQMHNSGLAANNLTAVAVLGNGAVFPPPTEKSPGALRGRFEWDDGKPVAGARVEICGTPASMVLRRGATPCARKPFRREAITGADGAFVIRDIPPAVYYVAVRPEDADRWRISFDARRTRVTPGLIRDAGTWRLRRPKEPDSERKKQRK